MKTFIRGNQVMVQTNIEEEDYNKYKGYGVFSTMDEHGDELYRVTKVASDGPSDITTFGIACNTVYQGKLTASAMFDGKAEEFIEFLQPRLLTLKEAEVKIAAQVEELKGRLEGIENTIIIEE